MKKIVLANWKAELSPERAGQWLDVFLREYEPAESVRLILAVSDFYMLDMKRRLSGRPGVGLAAQGVSPFPPGRYTGATPSVWLKGTASHTLLGHRERRRYFHETNQEVAAQVRESVAAGLQPILCVERAGAAAQLAALDNSDLERTIIAYTPADAVDLEVARGEEDIAETVDYLASLSGKRPVLYGGGVNVNNAEQLITMPGLDGIMAGGACLEPLIFADLFTRAVKALEDARL